MYVRFHLKSEKMAMQLEIKLTKKLIEKMATLEEKNMEIVIKSMTREYVESVDNLWPIALNPIISAYSEMELKFISDPSRRGPKIILSGNDRIATGQVTDSTIFVDFSFFLI